MKTKSISWVVAAGLVMPFAAQAELSFYGVAHVSLDAIDNGATSDASKLFLSSNTSVAGFKGSEDIDHGLKVLWQVEEELDMDTGASTASSNLNKNYGLRPRNTYLGVSGDFGRLIAGKHDTPYKMATKDILIDTRADYNAVIGNIGNDKKPFDNRQDNIIIYTAPKMYAAVRTLGFQFSAGFAPGETRGTDKDTYSLSGIIDKGPLALSLAYEEQHGTGRTIVGDEDASAFKLGGAWNMDSASTVSAIYEDIDMGGTIGSRRAYYLAGTRVMGVNTIKAAVGSLSNIGGNADTGALHYAIGWFHSLGKNTEVYGLYSAINNKANGNYGFGTNNITPASAGKDLSALSFGLVHKFSSQ